MWSVGPAHPHHRSQQEVTSCHGQLLNNMVSGAPTVGYLVLRTQPCQPVCRVASHEDQPQEVPVAPGQLPLGSEGCALPELNAFTTCPGPLHGLWLCPKALYGPGKGQAFLGGWMNKLKSHPKSHPTPPRSPYSHSLMGATLGTGLEV